MSSISETLKRICHDEEINSQELAKRAGLCSKTIDNFMKGSGTPNIYSLRKISKAFGIPMEDLKGEEEKEESAETANGVYAKIKEYCKKQDMTVVEFSAKIGISTSTLRKIDSKGINTRMSTFECIAEAMGVTAEELMNLKK